MLNIRSTFPKYLAEATIYSWDDSNDLNYWNLFSLYTNWVI